MVQLRATFQMYGEEVSQKKQKQTRKQTSKLKLEESDCIVKLQPEEIEQSMEAFRLHHHSPSHSSTRKQT